MSAAGWHLECDPRGAAPVCDFCDRVQKVGCPMIVLEYDPYRPSICPDCVADMADMAEKLLQTERKS